MKIDSNHLASIQDRTVDRTTTAGDAQSVKSGQTAAAGGDGMRLSPDAQLLQTALVAAKQAPDIRPDVVERMRALLADGKIGHDLGKLADAMIDNWKVNS